MGAPVVPGRKCIRETRERLLPKTGFMTKPPPVRTVFTVPAPKVLGLLFGVPLPMIEIPIPARTVTPVVQVQDPAGMMIVSPSTATWVGPLMTLFTSLCEQETAVTVLWECAGGVSAKQKLKSMAIASFRIIVSLSNEHRYLSGSMFKGFRMHLFTLVTSDRPFPSMA
jgi:hypothetical protein